MVYLKSVENVITLGKLIGLLFLFCLPLLSILFLKTKRNDLARPVMGTIFLVISVFNLEQTSIFPHICTITLILYIILEFSLSSFLPVCRFLLNLSDLSYFPLFCSKKEQMKKGASKFYT